MEPSIIFAAATELFASSLAHTASAAISAAAIVSVAISSVVIVPFSIFALVTASFARVVAIDIFAVPLKLAVPVMSPDTAIFLAV